MGTSIDAAVVIGLLIGAVAVFHLDVSVVSNHLSISQVGAVNLELMKRTFESDIGVTSTVLSFSVPSHHLILNMHLLGTMHFAVVVTMWHQLVYLAKNFSRNSGYHIAMLAPRCPSLHVILGC
jgi:hypothetical protein